MMTEMVLPVEKLEAFGLEKFITEFSFVLCDRTVSPGLVASALKFSFDEIAKINHPPEPSKQCQKLYQFIQRKSKVKDFLEALRETGNQHVIDFIESADFSSTSAQTPLTFSLWVVLCAVFLILAVVAVIIWPPSDKSNPKTEIWFNIPEPIDSFCGREDFLSQLHQKLQLDADSTPTPEVTVLSQVKIVSGLGGIGKTETATQYIHSHRQFYNNFIWINAESENSMRNSFIKLASELQIPVKNEDGKSRDIEKIVKEIYKKICEGGKSNLIIFDNAEDYQSCKNFFPLGLRPDFKRPVILATSRNQEWKSDAGTIQVLPLDVLTDDESLQFILTQLKIENSPEFREEAREFIELIGGLPLALQQAVAYIRQQKKDNRPFDLPYKMNDYVNEFKSKTETLQNFSLSPGSSATVFITWILTFEKIKKDPKGEMAIGIIQVISLLYADKIPVEFLLQLLPLPQTWSTWFWKLFEHGMDVKSTDLVAGLNILEKFSMIKIDSTGKFVSVHRQVQFVIIQNLKSCGELVKLFDHLVEKCRVILKSLKLSESRDIFLNVHQIVKNQFNFIPITQEYLDFMYDFGTVLWSASRYSESLGLFEKVHSKSRELLGENHKNTLASQHQIALQLGQLERYDESLTLFRETLRQDEIHLGPDHPNTIATKHNIANLLQQQKKYDESLELLQQVLAQQIKIRGENHPGTLSTQMGIAVVHFNLGDLPKALALYQDVEEKQTEILGPDHTDLLTTKHNKAIVLLRMCKLEEASKIFNDVYEKRKKVLGENHLNTISTLESIAVTLEKEGKLEEALELYKKVYEIRKTNLGENHPHTITVKTSIVNVERKLGGIILVFRLISENVRDMFCFYFI